MASRRAGRDNTVAEKSVKSEELTDAFNTMIGAKNPEITVVIPKYNTIMNAAGNISGILKNFVKSVEAQKLEAEGLRLDDIRDFIKVLDAFCAQYALRPLPPGQIGDPQHIATLVAKADVVTYQMSEAASYYVAGVGDNYKAIKTAPPIMAISEMLRNIKQALAEEGARYDKAVAAQRAAEVARDPKAAFKHNGKPRPLPRNVSRGNKCLETTSDLHADFIVNAIGDNLQLFPFSELCCKNVMLQDFLDAHDRRHFLTILHLLFVHSNKIVTAINTPDINVDKFGETMAASLQMLRPQLPGCDAAFRAIENSLGMFTENFPEYHKDFVASRSPGIILESFVADVSKKHNGSPVLGAQFKRIIQMYSSRLKSTGRVDPMIQNMMDMANENLSAADEQAKKNAASAERLRNTKGPADESPPDGSQKLAVKRSKAAIKREGRASPVANLQVGEVVDVATLNDGQSSEPTEAELVAFMQSVGFQPATVTPNFISNFEMNPAFAAAPVDQDQTECADDVSLEF